MIVVLTEATAFGCFISGVCALVIGELGAAFLLGIVAWTLANFAQVLDH